MKQYACICLWVCACANIRALALLTGIFTRPQQYEWHMHAKRQSVNSLLSAVDIFPAPNVCSCNAVKIPIMSLKCCEKSYVSCRPYCVG